MLQLYKISKSITGEIVDIEPVNLTDLKKKSCYAVNDGNYNKDDFITMIEDGFVPYFSVTSEPFFDEQDNAYIFNANVFISEDDYTKDTIALEKDDFYDSNEKLPSATSYFPKKVLAHLNEFVVGQTDAKKALSIEIFKHYCRMTNPTVELPKDNVLLTGPTGSGKTYMIEKLAELIDVPFAKCSATSLTESGYVGDDVETVLQDLLKNARGNVRKAEYGIVFIDEIDKIGRKSENPSITRDVSGEGVQTALLNMLGGGIVKVPTSGNRKHPQGEMIELNTKNILFIGAGCFEGIDKIVNARTKTNTKSIGFNQIIETKPAQEENFRKNIKRDDLLKFGMIPELIGRFSILANLLELTKEDLINICKLSNGEIQKYKNLFAMFEKDLFIEDRLYEQIADKAIKDGTGARGIKTAISELLAEYTYNIDETQTPKVNLKSA